MDVGQGEARALWNSAVSGEFVLEDGAARRWAGIFERYAEGLDGQIAQSFNLHRGDGFGDLVSAQQLAGGFGGKGQELTRVLYAAQEGARQMAAAYLRAGGLLEEADAANAAAIQGAATELER